MFTYWIIWFTYVEWVISIDIFPSSWRSYLVDYKEIFSEPQLINAFKYGSQYPGPLLSDWNMGNINSVYNRYEPHTGFKKNKRIWRVLFFPFILDSVFRKFGIMGLRYTIKIIFMYFCFVSLLPGSLTFHSDWNSSSYSWLILCFCWIMLYTFCGWKKVKTFWSVP